METWQKLKSERYIAFTEEISKIALSSNDNKKIESIDAVEKYTYGMNEVNFVYIRKEYPNWPEIPDHLYRIIMAGGSGSGKTNALLNLMNHEPDIDKIFIYYISMRRKISSTNYQKRKYRFKVFKWFKSFYWILKWYEWYL